MKNNVSESRYISTDNIFSINRLGLNDFESGKSLTIGLDYKKENKEDIDKFFEMKFATILRDVKNNKLPKSSTLNRTTKLKKIILIVKNLLIKFLAIYFS